ncbi:MAG: GTPase HflX [Candidatus Kaelpia imicola]|nr:GTPase HflX [Candidatus Kaelpia imicola]
MKESAYIVNVDRRDRGSWTPKERAAEMKELILSTGCSIGGEDFCSIKRVGPHYFIGQGKVGNIAYSARELGSDVIIFSQDLSAAQQQNIEDETGVKTIDRTQLILDVFSRHARSSEGKLQVELAQLGYLLPRLRGKGIMLSRLGAGIGTRGPGEKKLEVDRRRIRRRIEHLNRELKEVKKRRLSLRKRRARNEVSSIVLIGYTNAGKTTLLNLLTKSKQISSDSMFTTLDPVSRAATLSGKSRVVFSDTVGFLNDLPHHLIDAFRATFEEIAEADLILHLIDLSNPLAVKRRASVYKVLDQLGIKDKNILTVLNKIDKLPSIDNASLSLRYPGSIPISALNGEGVGLLLKNIESELSLYESFLNLFVPDDKLKVLDLIAKDSIIGIKKKRGGVYIRARVNLSVRERIYREISK